MSPTLFKSFLEALRDEAGALLCGSFARGDHDLNGHLSDIDLIVRCVSRMDGQVRPIDKAIEIFKRFEVPGESILVGQWSSPRDIVTLPRPVEVMEDSWVDPDKSLPPKVTVFGVEFATYRRRLRA